MSEETCPGYRVRFVPPKQAFIFVTPAGETVGRYSNRSLAWASAERHYRKSRLRKRDCITCGVTFMSEGVHNRMCRYCRKDRSEYHGC